MNHNKNSEKVFPRVIFIGDSGVGKTSIILKVTTGVFDPSPASTIGAGVRPISVNAGNKQYHFHLWDTAGQEIYRSIVPLYFKQAVCAVIVFSMTDYKSYQNITDWINILATNSDRNVPVVIVGNKMDLFTDIKIPESNESIDSQNNSSQQLDSIPEIGEHQVVEIPAIKKFCEERNYPLFFTSALTGENIKTMFEFIAENYVSPPNQKQEEVAQSQKDGSYGCC